MVQFETMFFMVQIEAKENFFILDLELFKINMYFASSSIIAKISNIPFQYRNPSLF